MKLWWPAAALLLGCSTTKVESHTHDNGQQRHVITCRNSVADCYQKAGDMCPDGYLVLNRVRGVRKDDYTEFELRIRCRSGKVFF